MSAVAQYQSKRLSSANFQFAIDDELLDAGHHDHVPVARQQVDPQAAGRTEVLLQRRGGGVVVPKTNPS
jgi:hypothetical protein